MPVPNTRMSFRNEHQGSRKEERAQAVMGRPSRSSRSLWKGGWVLSPSEIQASNFLRVNKSLCPAKIAGLDAEYKTNKDPCGRSFFGFCFSAVLLQLPYFPSQAESYQQIPLENWRANYLPAQTCLHWSPVVFLFFFPPRYRLISISVPQVTFTSHCQ